MSLRYRDIAGTIIYEHIVILLSDRPHNLGIIRIRSNATAIHNIILIMIVIMIMTCTIYVSPWDDTLSDHNRINTACKKRVSPVRVEKKTFGVYKLYTYIISQQRLLSNPVA